MFVALDYPIDSSPNIMFCIPGVMTTNLLYATSRGAQRPAYQFETPYRVSIGLATTLKVAQDFCSPRRRYETPMGQFSVNLETGGK